MPRCAAALIVAAVIGRASAAGAQEFRQFVGIGDVVIGNDEMKAAIAAFKAAIGGADNGDTIGSQPGGFRQVTWDDVPDQYADPNPLPRNFYNSRGLDVTSRASYGQIKVSANASNPTSTPILFGQSNFIAYSPQRIMAGFGLIAPVLVQFREPNASNVVSSVATVSGFGAVFTDVTLPNTSYMEFLDAQFNSLARVYVTPGLRHDSVSFLGVLFPTAKVAYVLVAPGNTAIQNGEGGTLDIAALDDFVYSEPQKPAPAALTVTTPTAAPTFTATGPFLSLAGTAVGASNGVSWQNDRGGSGTADGSTSWNDWIIHDIPLAPGINTISVTAKNANSDPTTVVLTVTSDKFAYYFAEGSTGSFFDTDILIANPNDVPAPITLSFLREDGGIVLQTQTIGATSRATIHVDDIPGLEATAFSTIVTSDNRLPLVVERTMFWGNGGLHNWGSKGAPAIDQPSPTWYFAEGVQNLFFQTFVQLENPGRVVTNASVTFQLNTGEAPVVRTVALPPLSRVTVDASTIPELQGRSFGLTVHADAPIVAERATYFESTPKQLWAGGHGSPGVPVPSTRWSFAEGATSSFRDTFLLLANPGGTTTRVQVTFESMSGSGLSYQEDVPAGSRLTIPLNDTLSSQFTFGLPLDQFAMTISSEQPIVAERAMYWHGAPGPWADGTSTFGVAADGLRWGLAEGRMGGPLNFHTYVRIANFTGGYYYPLPAQTANVKVTYLKSDGTTFAQTFALPPGFVDIDLANSPQLAEQSFGMLVESTNGVPIATERSMYWDADGVFWAGGITTVGTRLP